MSPPAPAPATPDSGPSASPTREPVLVRLLRRLAEGVYRYPRLFFYPQVILFVVAIGYTRLNLGFSTQRNDLVGSDKTYHRNFLAYKAQFRTEDDLVAVVESDDPGKNRQFVERLGARLRAETNFFTDVIYNNDVKMLGNKALLFFPESDLEALQRTLVDYRPFLQQFTRATNLHSLFRLVNQRFRTASRETNAENESLVQALPALRRIIEQATDSLARPGRPPAPGLTALFDAGAEAERQIYITFDNGRLFLATARARDDARTSDAVARLRELVEQTRIEVPGVNAAITGEPVLEVDEMAQAQRDTTVASIVSLVLVALIFIYGYNESGRPIKATICLMVGLAYTLAFATATVGRLNILTITFVPMLIGLAIDFGVHLVTRYEEELRHGRSERDAIGKAMVFTGLGISTGCFTTAGAFLAMGLTDFAGIQEMGIICGGGLLISLVPMMTLLPVLILRGRQNVLDHQFPEVDRRARIERLWLDRPWTVLAVGALLCLAAALALRPVRFDYNLLNLQTRGLAAVTFEKKLIQSAGKSVLYCAVVTDSLAEALALEAQVTNLSTVASVQSMARYLSEDQTQKLQLIGRIKAQLADIDLPEPDRRPAEVLELSRTLWSLQGYLGLAHGEASRRNADPGLLRELDALREAIGDFRLRLFDDDLAQRTRKLTSYQQALFDDLRETFEALRTQDDRDRMRVEDLPLSLRHRFVSFDGTRHLVQVYPRQNVWEREHQEAFIQQLRQSLDPNHTGRPIITGTPVQLFEYTTLLKESYETAALYALGAIALLVWIHFRSLTCVILSLIPVAVGTLWMVGYMGLAHLDFNPANIMTLPLVIGIGVTSGIHILNRYAEEHSPSILAKSTGKAVLVSGLTTIVGFGSLVLGQHQGIAGLGQVMAVGTATCMIAALTLLPALIVLLTRHGRLSMKEKTQWRNRKLDTGLGGTEAKASSCRRP